jgi:hypothetical protein
MAEIKNKKKKDTNMNRSINYPSVASQKKTIDFSSILGFN